MSDTGRNSAAETGLQLALSPFFLPTIRMWRNLPSALATRHIGSPGLAYVHPESDTGSLEVIQAD